MSKYAEETLRDWLSSEPMRDILSILTDRAEGLRDMLEDPTNSRDADMLLKGKVSELRTVIELLTDIEILKQSLLEEKNDD